MSTIYYDALRGRYALKIKKEWKDNLQIKYDVLYHKQRTALVEIVWLLEESLDQALNTPQRRKRKVLKVTIISLVILTACTAYTFTYKYVEIPILQPIFVKIGVWITLMATLTVLLAHYVSRYLCHEENQTLIVNVHQLIEADFET
jgi:hypothetical protein